MPPPESLVSWSARSNPFEDLAGSVVNFPFLTGEVFLQGPAGDKRQPNGEDFVLAPSFRRDLEGLLLAFSAFTLGLTEEGTDISFTSSFFIKAKQAIKAGGRASMEGANHLSSDL